MSNDIMLWPSQSDMPKISNFAFTYIYLFQYQSLNSLSPQHQMLNPQSQTLYPHFSCNSTFFMLKLIINCKNSYISYNFQLIPHQPFNMQLHKVWISTTTIWSWNTLYSIIVLNPSGSHLKWAHYCVDDTPVWTNGLGGQSIGITSSIAS